jgi:hypothetical protein
MKMKIASNVKFEEADWWEEQFMGCLKNDACSPRRTYKVMKSPPLNFRPKRICTKICKARIH